MLEGSGTFQTGQGTWSISIGKSMELPNFIRWQSGIENKVEQMEG
jgi:hypothetical protein